MNMNAVGSFDTSVTRHVSADTPAHPRKFDSSLLNIK
jgi:hypothetical protein